MLQGAVIKAEKLNEYYEKLNKTGLIHYQLVYDSGEMPIVLASSEAQ